MSYDVIVIGLGGMGSSAAARLSALGLRVLGLERFDPVHDQGSSHGESRIIRQAYFEDPAYVPLLRRSYQLWRELESDTGREIMRLTGGLMIGRRDSETVAGSVRSAVQWGLSHEVLDYDTLRFTFPTLSPAEDDVALYEPLAGYVAPEAAVSAHLTLATRNGADLRFREPVLSWHADRDGGVRVVTKQDTYLAGNLVVCPGAWAGELLAGLRVPFRVERQVQYWFHPAGETAPFTPERHPVYIWEVAPGSQFYGFPSVGKPEHGVKVAMFRGGQTCSPDGMDRTVHGSEVRAIREVVAPRIPTLPYQFLRAKTCMYTNTPDQHFVVAHHPDREQVVVACGFSGHGFKFVPVIGEIIADLVLEGETLHPIEKFHPGRLWPAAV